MHPYLKMWMTDLDVRFSEVLTGKDSILVRSMNEIRLYNIEMYCVSGGTVLNEASNLMSEVAWKIG